MKVLCFVNVMLPKIAEVLEIEVSPFGGWIVGLTEGLMACDRVEIAVAFPMRGADKLQTGVAQGLMFFGFPQKTKANFAYDAETEEHIKTIIKDAAPDVIHVFGTEYPHILAIVNACEKLGMLDRLVVGIQGLVSIYAIHYRAGLKKSLLLRREQNAFLRRGIYEVEALKKVKHVTGRTDWDRACTFKICPEAQYHFCNETLRDEFYNHSWDIEKCERNTIFLSQAIYPIKGLHYMLEALVEVIKKFPQTHVYVAGYDITKANSIKSKLKFGSYEKYIRKFIDKHNLSKHITFTGQLNKRKMRERYLSSHAFVSPSSIENSPNSLGEAMLLGLPSISSDVGGVKNMMVHGEDGYVYQHDAPYMLAYYICKIFSDDKLAAEFSKNAKAHAQDTHNRENNLEAMLAIYRGICER